MLCKFAPDSLASRVLFMDLFRNVSQRLQARDQIGDIVAKGSGICGRPAERHVVPI